MADTTTTTYGLTKPEVGASEDTWGTKINTNLDTIDDLLDGTTAIAPNLTAGSWQVGGVVVTATAAELNLLDGVTATTAELNYVDGVTSNVQTQLNTKAPTASPTFTGTVNMSGATVSLANDAISGDKVEGGTIAATTITDLTTSTINIGLWDIELDGSDLRFQYNGTDVFRITTAGAIIAKDEVTAFGSP